MVCEKVIEVGDLDADWGGKARGYGLSEIRNLPDPFDARRLMGGLAVIFDENAMMADFSISERARTAAAQLHRQIPLCYLADLTRGVTYFVAVAEVAGGFVSDDLGELHCVDGDSLKQAAQEEIAKFEAIAGTVGIHQLVAQKRVHALKDYFGLRDDNF